MTSTAQAFAQSLKLPPAEAVEAIAQRGDQMTVSWSWMDILNEQHSQQFTISRLTRADLLQAIHTSLAKSVNGDLNRTDWMRDTRALLQKAGWWGKKQSINSETGEMVQTKFDNARLKLIFDTNTRQAYSAGRWQRTVRNKASHPYIRYVTMKDEKVRHSHREWEGITLPVDHSFWRTHLPPNGFRCRCRWVAVTQAEYDKGYSEWRAPYSYDKDGKLKSIPPVERLEFKKTAPEITTKQYHNRSTGKTETIPVGIDPGFNYNAGEALMAARNKVITDKLDKLNPAIAAETLSQGVISEKTFNQWMKKPQGEMPLVALPEKDLALISSKKSIATLSPETIIKQLREHPELTAAEYLSAQLVIDKHTLKVQDSPTSLIYMREIAADDKGGGHVLVVKATRTGEGLFVTSYRRLSKDAAKRDSEIARLKRKTKK